MKPLILDPCCGIIHVEDGTPRIAYQRLSLTQSQLG